MRLVHSPSIPQKGMRTLKELVNKNMVFVLNLKYRCIYQKPNVEVIEQAAWVIPRYVICKKENETESFWIILTRVPIEVSISFVYIDVRGCSEAHLQQANKERTYR